ncbi:MAG: thiolase domain-containing protein [Krumholzibacteria bacterium]|nr:thiolase domain-containing protein [Candidatus Krumholzibacteria bacterium]
MRDVAVIGMGITKFGELWRSPLRDLHAEAVADCLADAGIERRQVQSAWIGCMSSGLFNGQEHLASILTDYAGLAGIAATRVESACASGGAAFRAAWLEVASGASDYVLATGVEKMNDGADATYCLSTAADQEYEVYHGVTFPGLYAMIAKAHMHKWGTTREQLADVAVKNHRHGALNPKAQFPQEITRATVLGAVMVASPLGLFDCSPVSDGAAAVLLAPVEVARALGKPVVRILGSGHATDTIALHDRADVSRIPVVQAAARRAFAMAGVGPRDIDLVEVHDCFTIAELVCLEELGFFEPGKAAAATSAGETALGGRIPVNTSGGLKSKGHPVGATGIAQIAELYEQLTGKAGKRQVKDARRGLAQNMGGSGGSCTVHILEVSR